MTATLSRKLRKLDDFLASEAVGEDAMLLGELDGFLAGIVTCPDLIAPSEWMPKVWGDEEPVFDDARQAEEILALIMGHYNDIVRQLDQRRYRPIYEFDTDDSALWEIWMEGFHRAMQLRPAAWLAFAENPDEGVQEALFIIGRLAKLSLGAADIEPIEIDEELEKIAPDVIAMKIEDLHHARLAQRSPVASRQAQVKVGRNDPCPCGSGKKYKKCCLN